MNNAIPVNEEEVKIKILLPWLKNIGVSLTDLKLEKSFRIVAGRHAININTQKQYGSSIGARLDILITRNNRNLILLEVKGPDHKITNQDREQSISYARLVHPIAPYTLISNGTDYELLDTLTMKVLKPDELIIDNHYRATLPDKDREEAISLFLGLSLDNLIAFCNEQVITNIKPLKGSRTELNKKYIPDLHETRCELSNLFDRFIRSTDPCFVLLGESGLGKTSSLCFLADRLLRQNVPVLFYSGLTIETQIEEAVSSEFEWTFNEQQSPISLLKKLNKLVNDTHLVLIIDAIDEWRYLQKVQSLVNFVKNLKHNNIKLVLSCKTETWVDFVEQQSTPTGLLEFVFKPSSDLEDIFSYRLGALTPKEFSGAITKYREIYQFKGAIENKIYTQIRSNPFLMKICFEVAYEEKLENITIESYDLLHRYYKQLLEKTSDNGIAEATIIECAKYLYENNIDSIEEIELKRLLGLNINGNILADLFSRNIMIRSCDQNSATISFYFQLLRDFIVAFYVLGLHKKTPEDLRELYKNLAIPSVRHDVLSFYYRQATEQQTLIFEREARGVAKEYINVYVKTIDEYFPKIREKFEPYTKDNIGFFGIIGLDDSKLHGYGIRAIKQGDENIILLPVRSFEGFSLPRMYGVEKLKICPKDGCFNNDNLTKKILIDEIGNQLWEIVRNHELFEGNCKELLEELAISIIVENKRIFSSLIGSRTDHITYPIELEGIHRGIKKERLRKYYENEWINEKRKTGEINENWMGEFVGLSIIFTDEYFSWLESKVEEALKSDEPFDEHISDVDLRNLCEKLYPCIESIRGYGQSISKTLFEHQENLKSQLLDRYSRQVDVESVKRFLVDLYNIYLENYCRLIENNFPSFREAFDLYSSMPVAIYIRIGEENIFETDTENFIPLTVYIAKATDGSIINRIIICEPDDIEENSPDDVYYKGKKLQDVSLTFTTVENLLGSTDKDPSLLRTMVYEQILGEMIDMFSQLVSQKGISINSQELSRLVG